MRRRGATTAVLAVLAVLVFCASAQASATFTFTEVSHEPTTVNRGDEYLAYSVKLKNAAAAGLTPGSVLQCQVGTWTPEQGQSGSPGFSYQWLRDGVSISGQTGAKYTLVAADEGHSLQCEVTAYNASAATSEVTAPLQIPPATSPVAPQPTVPTAASSRPVIIGTASSGSKLTCAAPTGWSGEGIVWSFEWLRNGAHATGAIENPTSTTSTYTVQASDVSPAAVLQCRARATNSGGAASAISNATPTSPAPVGPPSNSASTPPAILVPNATSGTTTISVALPAGVKLFAGTGGGWSCHPAARTCTSSEQVNPGGEFSPLKLEAWIYPEEVPGTLATVFTAFGGGAGGEAIGQDSVTLGPESPFEILGFSAAALYSSGATYTQAGGHPFAASSAFRLPVHTTPNGKSAQGNEAPVQDLRDLYINLPAGFVGNPESVATACTVAEVKKDQCPESAAVGGVGVKLVGFDVSERSLYRVIPEEGFPAAFAFRPLTISPITVVLRAKLRTNGDYGVTAVGPLPPQTPELLRIQFAKLCSFGAAVVEGQGVFTGCKEPASPGSFEVPFLTNNTRCFGPPPLTTAAADSYQHPGVQDAEGFPDLSDPNWKSAQAASPSSTGCEALAEAWTGNGPEPEEEEPSFTLQPDSSRAAAPAGYTAELHIPQQGLVERNGLATAHLKDTTVLLPRGIALNPAAAAGLGSCSEAQAGYLGNEFPTPNPVHFSSTAPGCPDDSKIGTVEVSTPLLPKPLTGSVYLATQDENPFASDFAIYLVIDDRETGIHATLAGEVEPSGSDEGRIATTFLDNPQVPFEDFKLNFFSGPRASLVNPDVCGTYTTQTELTPWSAADPDHPTAGEIARPSDPISIEIAPEGQASCPASKAARPFALGFEAGVSSPLAGAHSAFNLRLTRPDGDQEIAKVTATTPPGFAATLKGVSICSQSGIERAEHRNRAGDGAEELADPSCPVSSLVGTTTIAAGAGEHPFYVKTGKIYLSGPYKGAPLSLTFVVPAVAGPFDLGVQVVRTALRVNPKNAQITAESDPIPQILDGVPLQIRDILVSIDRPDFALNPTSCEQMSVTGQVAGASGATANLQTRFQVGGCSALGFHPNLRIQLHGGTRRAAFQQLTATLTAGEGEANIARAAVTLPHSEFLAQEHIRTVCTRVQFAVNSCPPGSVYGHAEAISPLLDQPLAGPVYLRSSSNPLPDLVAALRGPDSQPIEVELDGRTDSVHGGLRNTFDVVPDAPVSKFTLSLLGGQKSLIVNSRDLCTGPKQRATVDLTAQNGAELNFRPVVGNDCSKKGNRSKRHRHHARASSLRGGGLLAELSRLERL